MDLELIDFYEHIVDDAVELKILELIEEGFSYDKILENLLEMMAGDFND